MPNTVAHEVRDPSNVRRMEKAEQSKMGGSIVLGKSLGTSCTMLTKSASGILAMFRGSTYRSVRLASIGLRRSP